MMTLLSFTLVPHKNDNSESIQKFFSTVLDDTTQECKHAMTMGFKKEGDLTVYGMFSNLGEASRAALMMYCRSQFPDVMPKKTRFRNVKMQLIEGIPKSIPLNELPVDDPMLRLLAKTRDKSDRRHMIFMIQSTDKKKNTGYYAYAALVDVILQKWTPASAETIYFTLKRAKEHDVAQLLGISQPSVNKRKKVAGWNGLDAILQHFERE